MPTYTTYHNYVQVVGYILEGQLCTYEYTITPRDGDEIVGHALYRSLSTDEDTTITREDVAAWLSTHSGDFHVIIDFCASIGKTTIDWEEMENASLYNESVDEYGLA